MKSCDLRSAALVIASIVCHSVLGADGLFQLEVHAGKTPLFELPVSVDLPESFPEDSGGAVGLRQAGSGELHPAQIHTEGTKRELIWIVDALDAGAKRTYTIEKALPQSPGAGVEVQRAGGDVKILIDGEHFTTYVTQGAGRPYFWPMIGPTGQPMTRAYPMRAGVDGERTDHKHHRSFWFGYDKVNGHDFWRYGKSSTVHEELLDMTSGPVFGELTARVDWISEDGQKVCEDVRRMRVYRTGVARVFDFRIELRASEGPVQLGDSEEGMLGFRVAGSMKVESGGTVLNARGDRNGDAWGKRAPWCDYSGRVAGEVVGIAVLDDPRNLRHPTYWHVRPYGLFCANRFGVRDFTKEGDGSYRLAEGESLSQAYRVYFHRGDAVEGRVAEAYANLAEPPRIRWTKSVAREKGAGKPEGKE